MNKQVVQKTLWFPYRCKAKDFTLYYSNQNSLTFGVRIEVCKLMVIDRAPCECLFSGFQIQMAERFSIRGR